MATKTKKAEPKSKATTKKATKAVEVQDDESNMAAVVTATSGVTGITSSAAVAGVTITRVEFEVPINAAPDRVWFCLTRETSNWWPKSFYTSERTQRFVIMAKLGGLVGEDFGRGGGVIWYSVIGVCAPTSLTLLGHLTPTFGGPSMSTLEITLEPQGNGTLFKVVDAVMGVASDGFEGNLLSGWKTIFGENLKKWVESRPTGPVPMMPHNNTGGPGGPGGQGGHGGNSSNGGGQGMNDGF